MEGDIEIQRLKTATESRSNLEQKYDLATDPRYDEAKQLQRDSMHNITPELRNSTSSQKFGQLIDQKVIEPILDKFGGDTEDTYGSRLKAAFVERMGEKARDEISLALVTRNISPSSETQDLIESLNSNDSAESLGIKLDSLLSTPEISSIMPKEMLFEAARDAKIDEFEFFYQSQAA
jgi:hypothetical protein